jgi:single-stranded-DNA-specific exonuclease
MSESLIVTPKFKNWLFLQPNEAAVISLNEELQIHIAICQLLVLRGVKNKEEAYLFLNPKMEHLHDPFLMKDMDIAVERIHQAISKKEKILIYGDYDVDGITAVSMLYTFFRNFYDNISYYVPDRNKEGCGISFEGIDFAREDTCKLIIALDCGVKDHEKVNYARQNGVDIIICDHHLPDPTLPEAVAVLDPKRPDCEYPFKELSGCGVGFKLLQAYTQKYQPENIKIDDYLDFVVVSIAADTVSVTGENRILAHYGMMIINENTRVGFKAILDIVNSKKKLELMDLVFTISPRINAAGRILHASYAVELLIEKDENAAKIKAQLIHDNNSDRQVIDKDITTSALDIIEDENFEDKKAIVIYQPHWHQGVIAIVASRLVEQFHKPTLILTESNGLIVGSGRSVPGFDLHEAINACSEYVIQFGGHKYAAGLSMKKENIDDFIVAFHDIVEERILEEQLIPKIEIDAIVELEDINTEFYQMIEMMAPFGSGNHKPVFVTRNVKDTGNNGFVGKSHLKLHVSKLGQAPKSGIGFGMWDYIPYLRNKGVFDICYQMYLNEWNGQKNVEIRLKDLK